MRPRGDRSKTAIAVTSESTVITQVGEVPVHALSQRANRMFFFVSTAVILILANVFLGLGKVLAIDDRR